MRRVISEVAQGNNITMLAIPILLLRRLWHRSSAGRNAPTVYSTSSAEFLCCLHGLCPYISCSSANYGTDGSSNAAYFNWGSSGNPLSGSADRTLLGGRAPPSALEIDEANHCPRVRGDEGDEGAAAGGMASLHHRGE